MNIILDVNIFISAIKWSGKPRTVFERIVNGLDKLLVTDAILVEIEQTFKKPKFGYIHEEVKQTVLDIERLGVKVTVHPHHQVPGVCRDSDDDKYLSCAIAANADYIITGDKDLLVLKEYNGIKIITAKEYLEIVNP
jgi:putative PIN family toxin of toxin-antitoxin system